MPAPSLDRLAPCYASDAYSGALAVYDDPADSQWSSPPAFPDATGGLVSTVDDYLAFGHLMLNNGRYGSERILSRPAVQAMTTDQLTPAQRAASAAMPVFLESRGWGFGLSIITRRDDIAAVPGRFGWDGGLGTSWGSDPAEDLVAILMTQRLAGPGAPRIDLDFWTSVYQAIED